MRSRRTDWHDSLNCAVLSDIIVTTLATKLDTSRWKMPTDIKLTDENLNISRDIDLLLGADLFYEMLRSGRRTRHGNPAFHETVLGWKLSGKTPVSI